jgi:ABC-2 type transport system permease protein
MFNIYTIAKREYKLYFSSGVAYVILAVILGIIGYLFFAQLVQGAQYQQVPDLSIVFGPLATLLMLVTPVLTARLLAEERRMGTIELLLTAPVRDVELVIGKWLGAYLFFLTVTGFTIFYPLLLNNYTQPGLDQGPLLSGYLGVMLLTAVFAAIGVAFSALFNNQFLAFGATLGVLVFLWWIVGPIAQSGGSFSTTSEVMAYFDLASHYYDTLMYGVIDLKDVVFFLSVTVFGIFVGSMAVETRRWS